MGLLYSLRIGNKVIILSISTVLGLGILIDTPYMAEFMVTVGGSESLLGVFIIHIPSGGKVGISVLGLSIL